MQSIRSKYALVALVVATVVVTTGHCSDPATHMAVAKRSLVVWQSFDPAFYDVITSTPTEPEPLWVKRMTMKFYLIGATLPDLFWDGQQTAASELLGWLYDNPEYFFLHEWGPLFVEQNTYDDTRDPISFPGHHDLVTLEQMAKYARSRGWGPIEKALIYGAYFHVIQDRYGHMVMQPSRFGHGFALYDASNLAYPKPDPMEQYHELFAGTHVAYDDYEPVTGYLFMGRFSVPVETALYGGLEFYFEYDLGGNKTKWQAMTFPAVSRFAQAANQYGGSLSHDKLRAYMHAWAIALGLAYGYWPAGNIQEQGPHSGGIVGHPTWTPDYIVNEHMRNMITRYTVLNLIPDVLDGLRQKLWQNILKGKLGDWVSSPTQGDKSWTWYFQSTQGIDEMWLLIPETERTEERRQAKELLKEKVRFLDGNSDPEETKPNLQATYHPELADEMSLLNLLRGAVTEGRSGIDYNKNGQDQLSRSWKAMLLGGMYGIQNPSWYYRQPGVLEAGFKKDGQPCWTDITVGLQGDPVYASLAMDLVTFGGTRVQMVGKTQGGQDIILQPHIPDCAEACRWNIDQPYNLQNAVNLGATEVSFTVSTQNRYGSGFQLMLGSDYRAVYSQHENIRTNPFYQSLFNGDENGANPFRTSEQNPFTNPRAFWPYAIRLNVVNWYLNAPTGLQASIAAGQPLGIVLEWFDNSSHESEYEVEKTTDGGAAELLTAPAGTGGRISWTDYEVQPGCIYTYRVRAKRESWTSDFSNLVQTAVTYSDAVPVTAYNNANKVLISGGNVHLTYFGQSPVGLEQVVYLSSSDGGNTWGPIEVVNPTVVGAMFPSLALDSQGEPYVVWVSHWNYGADGDIHPRWFIDYNVSWKENGSWVGVRVASIEADTNRMAWPEYEPPQASFAVRGDSGFIAFVLRPYDRLKTSPGLYYVSFPLRNHYPQLQTTKLDDYTAAMSPPVMLVDHNGRKVVAYAYSGYEDCVVLRYKDAGDFQRQQIDGGSPVSDLTAGLESGGNLLLAWSSGGDLRFRRLLRQQNGYTAQSWESVDDNTNRLEVHPKFVSGSSGGALLVYERSIQDDQIWYAQRLAQNRWIRGPASGASAVYDLSYPQAFASGYKLTTYCTGKDRVGGPFFLVGGTPATLPAVALPRVKVDTAPGQNNGRLLAVEPGSGKLHVTAGGESTVVYVASTDNGLTWPEYCDVDAGTRPSICLDPTGTPRIAYLRSDTLWCAVVAQTPVLVYAGAGTERIGQPSVQTYPVDVGGEYAANVVFAVYDTLANTSRIVYAKVGAGNVVLGTVSFTTGFGDSCPCVNVANSDSVFVTWQHGGQVSSSMLEYAAGTWAAPGDWSAPESVAAAGTQPMSALDGEFLHLVWREQDTVDNTEVIRSARRYVGPDPMNFAGWESGPDLSLCDTGEKMNPVYAGAGVVVWQERAAEAAPWNIRGRVWGDTVTLVMTDSNSYHPHAVALRSSVSPVTSRIELKLLWTEEVVVDGDTFGELRFAADAFDHTLPPGDAGVLAVVSPVGSVVESTLVAPAAVVKNFGPQPESVVVRFEVLDTHRAAVYSYQAGLVLEPDSSATVVFDGWRAAPAGSYTAVAYTVMPNDTNPDNDRCEAEFLVRVRVPWTRLADVPLPRSNKTVFYGGALAAGDAGLYALKGNATKDFYRYLPQSDTWLILDTLSGADKVGTGGALALLGGRLYALKGNPTRRFFGYEPAAGTWVQLPDLPGTEPSPLGGALVGAAGMVYALKNNSQEFHAFDPDSAVWTRKADIPLGPENKKAGYGVSLACDGTTIYAFKGNQTRGFYAYDPALDVWTRLSEIPAGPENKNVAEGGALAYLAPGYLFGFKGGATCHYYSYDIQDSAWQVCETIPRGPENRTVGWGGALAGYDGLIYALKGYSSTGYWVYTPNPVRPGQPLGGGQQSAGRVMQPALYGCRPNPFAARTAIAYQIPVPGRVLLRVYDVTGRMVRTLQNGEQNPGRYTVNWDGRDEEGRRVSAGIYFYRLDTDDFRDTKKAVLTR